MDTLQILLVIVLSLTTLILTIVGIQLMFVLTEARSALKKLNKIIHSFDTVGMNLHQGLGEIAGFINGIKSVIKILEVTSSKKNESSKQ
ncbi:hypothetical protein A2966_02275 [Candidatus Roizmanbacteria bacterium RIFCSPLOWO2_01_FULL_41_22]|uniref:DUF948 domain-containing protein n=2 Tax=Candidatus Roizmaniibacteriota TaxID=1752723 RepID=A0A1F7JRU6_9BACT|nr:MAG: hypothetical protein A2966_02275 [Candidatus Roizmanbacteria bacterium RIFCSPLOWO2_01_FULL_41_22]OGK58342.1 MAG: hypothetical protein A3H86_03225 [Candidatus Roizmanbacteria bacterium RIFCSPLOWO2_02_FULL_41_9]